MLFGLYGETHAVTRLTQELAVDLRRRGLSVSIVTPRTDPAPWSGLPASVPVTPLAPGMRPDDLAQRLRSVQRLDRRERIAAPDGPRPADVILFSGFDGLAMPKARVGGAATEPRTEFSFPRLEEALARSPDVCAYVERAVKAEREGQDANDPY